MLTAIEFDHEMTLVANKVDDISSYRHLPTETQAIKTVSAQGEP